MLFITRFLASLFLAFQLHIQVSLAGVEHLRQEDEKCFPYDFNYKLEEQYFVKLLVIPYLDKESISDLSKLAIIPDGNPRDNQFLSCMWKNKGFQRPNGRINFDAIQIALGRAIGREVGDTGPGNNLGRIEAARIISECRNLQGASTEHTVVMIRNCILMRIKRFATL